MKMTDAPTLRFFAEIGFTRGEVAKLLGLHGSTIRHHARKHGVKFPKYPSLMRRFHKCYKIVSESGCWIWTGSVDTHGYGNIRSNGSMLLAHRLSYQTYKGEIPKGHFICHRCDTPSCVNPDHLFAGSHSENMADMVRKGRARALNGEAHPNSKITARQVREIYKSNSPICRLAKSYGVSQSLVSAIKSGKRWSSVTEGM